MSEDGLISLFKDIGDEKMAKIIQRANGTKDQEYRYTNPLAISNEPPPPPDEPEPTTPQEELDRESLYVALNAIEPAARAVINERMTERWGDEPKLTNVDYAPYDWIASMSPEEARGFTYTVEENATKPAEFWVKNFEWQRMEPFVWGTIIAASTLGPMAIHSRAPSLTSALLSSAVKNLPTELGTGTQLATYPRELLREGTALWPRSQTGVSASREGLRVATEQAGRALPGTSLAEAEALTAEIKALEEAGKYNEAAALLRKMLYEGRTPSSPSVKNLITMRQLQGRGIPEGLRRWPEVSYQQPGAVSRFGRYFRAAPEWRALPPAQKLEQAWSAGFSPSGTRQRFWNLAARLKGIKLEPPGTAGYGIARNPFSYTTPKGLIKAGLRPTLPSRTAITSGLKRAGTGLLRGLITYAPFEAAQQAYNYMAANPNQQIAFRQQFAPPDDRPGWEKLIVEATPVFLQPFLPFHGVPQSQYVAPEEALEMYWHNPSVGEIISMPSTEAIQPPSERRYTAPRKGGGGGIGFSP